MLVVAAALATVLAAPVPGPVVRAFDLGADPFEPGRHRGADFAAAPGTRARAACAGRVAYAGPVPSGGRVVTVRCGRWSVTHLPLATTTVHSGATVRAGAAIGKVAASRHHAGLHLGVRRTTDRFGYIDPLRLLHTPDPPAAPPPFPPTQPNEPTRQAAPTGEPTQRPAPTGEPAGRPAPTGEPAQRPAPTGEPAGRPGPSGRAAPSGRAEPAGRPEPAGRAERAGRPEPALPPTGPPLAPWPAWAGLALVLGGAAGAAVRARPQPRPATLPRSLPEQVR